MQRIAESVIVEQADGLLSLLARAAAKGYRRWRMTKRIPTFRLDAHPLTPEAEAAAGFACAESGVGTRHRIGGEPDGRNQGEYPVCPSCRERMTFYGQLDSVGDDIVLADAGVVHVFVCFNCFEAAATIASA